MKDEDTNAVGEKEKEGKEEDEGEDGGHYDLEMSIDEQAFDGDLREIKEGSFVSFKYIGMGGGVGHPLNPKVSFIPFSLIR